MKAFLGAFLTILVGVLGLAAVLGMGISGLELSSEHQNSWWLLLDLGALALFSAGWAAIMTWGE